LDDYGMSEAEKESRSMGFELGVLTSRVQGVIERVDRFEQSVSRQMGDMKAQITEFGTALRTLAEGYVRREEWVQFKLDAKTKDDKLERDIDTIATLVRDLKLAEAGSKPLIKMGWEAVKWLAVIGIALYTGHHLPT
jgi:hypothetical protein